MFPSSDFTDKAVRAVDPAVQALAAQDTDLDLDHVEPAGVLRGVVELQTARDAACFSWRKGLVEGTGRMDRQVILYDPDALGVGKMDIDEFPHTLGVILGGAPLGDFHIAPRSVDVDADEEIDGAVAAIFAVVAFELARLGR